MTESTVAAGGAPTCPLPAAVRRHPAEVTPCARHAAHGGRCRPAEPENTCPEGHPLPFGMRCKMCMGPFPFPAEVYVTHGHVPRPVSDAEPVVSGYYHHDPTLDNEPRTLLYAPPVPAYSRWYEQIGAAPAEKPRTHYEIREDGSVYATTRHDGRDVTFLAYDPCRPFIGDEHTVAAPEVVHDAVRRYNAPSPAEEVVYDVGDAIEGFDTLSPTAVWEAVRLILARIHPNPPEWTGWTSGHVSTDEIRGMTEPLPRLADAAVAPLAAKATTEPPEPVTYRPDAGPIATVADTYAAFRPYAELAAAWTAEAVRARLCKVTV